jgi:hypothetical protein
MSEPIRVFVNGSGVSVAPGSSVLDAVTAMDPAAADDVRAGTRIIVDSRGLPVANDTAVHGGYVMRIVSARQARATED